jgi:hypothetical protein
MSIDEAFGPFRADDEAALAGVLLRGARGDGWRDAADRLARGLGLGSIFGAALGARTGGTSILADALGVPVAMVAVSVIAVPAFAIVLALADAPITGVGLARAASRSAARGGLLLAGVSPASLLYVLTVEDAASVGVVGVCRLVLAGGVAARSFVRELEERLVTATPHANLAMRFAVPSFLLFATVLFLRVAWIVLPAVRGGA